MRNYNLLAPNYNYYCFKLNILNYKLTIFSYILETMLFLIFLQCIKFTICKHDVPGDVDLPSVGMMCPVMWIYHL